ncbi:MAG: hypothetical protein ACJ75H_02330 [Thermoanaerobaculia bacterium]
MIVIQFDANYLHWGVLLLRSLALHEPRKRVLADTVGLSPAQAAEVRAAHPGAIVEETPAPAGGTSRDFMVNLKPYLLRRVMDDHPREPWYCLFDADFLVRRPLTDLWSCMRWASAGVIHGPASGVWDRIASGLVLLRPEARPLVESWVAGYSKRSIGGVRRGCFFFDQATLALAYERTPLRYARIPGNEYLDVRFRPDSSIWSAHVAPEDKDRAYCRFLAEHERQLREARGSDRAIG